MPCRLFCRSLHNGLSMHRRNSIARFLPDSSPLSWNALLVAALIAMPVLSVFSNVLAGGTSEIWSHLATTVLPEFIRNTIVLCIVVGLGVASIGIVCAWFTTMFEFPGR